MARKTVRIEIPSSSPDTLISLAEAIGAAHKNPENKSPLNADKVKAMAERASTAKDKRAKADALDAQATRLRSEADALIGTGAGQTSETKDTLLNDITGFRDLLLVENRGNEDVLGEFGFNVVVGTAAARTRPNPAPALAPAG